MKADKPFSFTNSPQLVDRIVDKRLLVTASHDNQVVVEVALESLLRQSDEPDNDGPTAPRHPGQWKYESSDVSIALADLVEFLVKRGLHFCKGATGSLDCGVTASSSLHRSSAEISVDTKTEKQYSRRPPRCRPWVPD